MDTSNKCFISEIMVPKRPGEIHFLGGSVTFQW